MVISRRKLYIYTLMLYFICLPLNAMNIGKIGSLLKIFAIFPIVIGFSNLKLKFNNLLKWQSIFTLFALLSIIWSVSKENSLGRIFSYVELLVLLFSASTFEFTKEELNKLKIALVWSSRITAVITLKYGIISEGRLLLSGVINEDPNYLCAYFSFGSIFALQRLIEKDRVLEKMLGIIEIGLYIFVIFMTGSRGGLIAIFACIISYFLALLGKSNIKKSIGIICVFIVIVVTCTSFIDYLPSELSDRFTIENVENSGGSGRMEIWKNGLDLYNSSSFFMQLFGYGTATIRYCFRIFNYSKVNVMHNIFLEILLELGLIGLILYGITIFKFVKVSLKFEDKFAFSVIVCMVVMSLSTSIYTFKPYINIMLFIILIYNYMNKIKNEQV